MSDLKNKISVSRVEQDYAQIFYLSPKLSSPEMDGASRISMEPKTLSVKLKSHSIKSRYQSELAKDLLNLHGVDPKDMFISTMRNEMELNQERGIYESMHVLGSISRAEDWTPLQQKLNSWFGFSPRMKIPRIEEIQVLFFSYSNRIHSRNGIRPGGFIIIGSGLYETVSRLNSFAFLDSNGIGIRKYEKIGTIGSGLQVILNRDLKYDDLTVVIGAEVKHGERGIYLLESEEGIHEVASFNDGSNPETLLMLSKKFAIAITENARFNYYTLQLSHKRYNLFRFFVQKIKDHFKK